MSGQLRAFLVSITCLGLLACSAPHATNPDRVAAEPAPKVVDGFHLILPGMSVGGVWMDMTADQVVNCLGKPERVVGRAYDYPSRGLAVFLDQDHRVVCIVGGGWCEPREPTMDAFRPYRTAEGLGVDSPVDDLRKVLGEPERIDIVEPEEVGMTVWHYNQRGIRFGVLSGRVVHITVLRIKRT